MSPFLIAALGALIALFLVLIEPTRRNVRALQIAAVATAAGSLAAWIWPIQALHLIAGVFLLALLGPVARIVFWPIGFIAQLLRSQ